MTLDNKEQYLEVFGAQEHNLKNIDVSIPMDKLVVITGLSGSGKSSLAFDTIYAEGQRRYIETFSSYLKNFLGNMERPKVDKINGLSPVISIEQKSTNKNPRSTVGTITEIYDFLRLMYARLSDAYSYNTGEKMVQFSDEEILKRINDRFQGQKVAILAPVVKNRKGHYRELLESIRKKGFIFAWIDGEMRELELGMKLDRYKNHDIDIVIDRLSIKAGNEERLKSSVELALKNGNNVLRIYNYDSQELTYFSRELMCSSTGLAYPSPEPNSFSFNSPKGACPACRGIGEKHVSDISKIVPDEELSIKQGVIQPLKNKKSLWVKQQIEAICKRFAFKDTTPWKEIPEEGKNALLYGFKGSVKSINEAVGVRQEVKIDFGGFVNYIQEQFEQEDSQKIKREASEYISKIACPDCGGQKLKIESLHFKINEKNIAEVSSLDILTLKNFIKETEGNFSSKKQKIAEQILLEINKRIDFLLDVGLGYLSLGRQVKTLSGGESQRIRLATQIGSQLEGVLYILDEPSIGLHQRDNTRLINSLKSLRDIGNSVMVVEHDREIMEEADYILDLGPGAGKNGGSIIAQGKLEDIMRDSPSTGAYLNFEKYTPLSQKREGNGEIIELIGATGNNLQDVHLKLPLGKLVAVTGVSGSGKSTLINETLYPILNHHFYRAVKKPMPYKEIKGIENIDKIVDIDQAPIGRSPRSNPATYTGVWTPIRKLFAEVPEAKIRGYKIGRFSFNVKGGRCEECQGGGQKLIEMNFLPDVYVPCETCRGKRFNKETLEIRYKGKNINDILEMSIKEAAQFFDQIPSIYRHLKTLVDVGLGYIHLGQSSTTLSGGEAQRVKLASELSKRDTGKTLFILDEPTTGLHFQDVHVLMEVLNAIVDKGNTVVVIEHNMDVIKNADHIIDLGPEGGDRGGEIMAEGDPYELMEKDTLTAKYLKEEIEKHLKFAK
ncbi:MAG: excinuclease ABC subunit UvrA [Flavobacteriales bacterium]|jgi:excinuclease ABC subunit A|nr:excinuclease ABC subunit UvrA [Flavobacteriales bacterium]